MFKKTHPAVGARPGTLVISPNALPSRVRVTQFDRERIHSRSVASLDELPTPTQENGITWVDVQGVGTVEVLERLAENYQIHPLALEDLVNVPQTPKVEQYGAQLLVIVHTVDLDSVGRPVSGQIGLIMGPRFVLTVHDQYNTLLAPVEQRLERPGARLRQFGPDYLTYAIMDVAIDGYYPVLGRIGEQLEALEHEAIDHPSPVLLRKLHRIKNALINLRRSVWPQRSAIHSLVRDEHALITRDVAPFLRDTYDHCVQTSEVIDMYREMSTSLFNTYLSSVGHRTNEIMKVLTIMSSIFVPLTFLAGIYGMNFEHMPELSMRWAYPSIWVAMLIMVGSMLWFFARKGWLWPQPIDVDAAPTASVSAEDLGHSLVRVFDEHALKGRRKAG